MKSINKLVAGLMLGLAATMSIATAQSFEGQIQVSTLKQLEQASASPEHQFLSANAQGSEAMLLLTLGQITKSAVAGAKTDYILSEQLIDTKKTNVLLEHMAAGMHSMN